MLAAYDGGDLFVQFGCTVSHFVSDDAQQSSAFFGGVVFLLLPI